VAEWIWGMWYRFYGLWSAADQERDLEGIGKRHYGVLREVQGSNGGRMHWSTHAVKAMRF